jgi:hypothetical protein
MTKRKSAKQEQLEENSHLLRQWKRWHAEQRDAALRGPHGRLVGQLLEILRSLTLADGGRLVRFCRAQDWDSVDSNTRFICVHEVNEAITRLRVKAGLPPFDDCFPPERATAFSIIKRIIDDRETGPPDSHAPATMKHKE